MNDYTKAGQPPAGRGVWRSGLVACVLALTGLAAGIFPPEPLGLPPPPAGFDFSGWHFPVPAGDWLISRGPCGGRGLYNHQCGYFEDECAFDLTPLSGSMLNVPVLAPQAGQVFFLGTRTDSGLAVLLQHADGRVSALFHLAKVVVGLDQRVVQGQVIGYAGDSGSSTGAHLHFDVQPNAVERTCLPLYGIDEVDQRRMILRSHNLAWPDLVLPDPPAGLPNWLPLMGAGAQGAAFLLPRRVELAAASQASVPVAIASSYLGTQALYYDGQPLQSNAVTNGYTVFSLPVSAPESPGEYLGSLEFRVAGPVQGSPPLALAYVVRAPMDSRASAGLVWINPHSTSPADYSVFVTPPPLCFSEPAVAGPAPLTFRVLVTGAAMADSSWIPSTCWTPPPLPHGTFYWKVFVRDAQGRMNRTNDRPQIFKIQ